MPNVCNASLRRCAALSDGEALPPGSKVVLTNAHVRSGVIALEPGCIKVLGGRVEALVEAWQVQRLYAGRLAVGG